MISPLLGAATLHLAALFSLFASESGAFSSPAVAPSQSFRRDGYFYSSIPSDFSVIDAKAERKLIVRAKKGDREALDALLRAHKGWFMRWARFYAKGNDDLCDDLFQEANVIAIECLKWFKPELGYRLLTYLTDRLAQQLRKKAHSGVIRTPAPSTFRQLSPETQEMAMRAMGTGPIPLSVKAKPTVFDDGEIDRLNSCVNQLREREKVVVRWRSEGYKLDQIANAFGVTRERVRQIEISGMKRLRELMHV